MLLFAQLPEKIAGTCSVHVSRKEGAEKKEGGGMEAGNEHEF